MSMYEYLQGVSVYPTDLFTCTAYFFPDIILSETYARSNLFYQNAAVVSLVRSQCESDIKIRS